MLDGLLIGSLAAPDSSAPSQQSGNIVPEYDVPEIREVLERPYRIIYRVKSDQINVLAVVHGAQLLPPES